MLTKHATSALAAAVALLLLLAPPAAAYSISPQPAEAIAPADWTMVLYIIVVVALLVLGFLLHAVFFLVAGVAGFFFTLHVWNVTQSTPLSILFAMLSLILLIVGAFKGSDTI